MIALVNAHQIEFIDREKGASAIDLIERVKINKKREDGIGKTMADRPHALMHDRPAIKRDRAEFESVEFLIYVRLHSAAVARRGRIAQSGRAPKWAATSSPDINPSS